MLGETEDEYRRLLYVAMTRAADRLIVGGCMPGNMNSVREFSWYDLIVKGLGNSGLQLQEIETADGLRKALFAARGCHGSHRRGRRAGGQRTGPSCRHGCAGPRRGTRRRQSAAPVRSRRGRGHPVRSGESVQLRARALLRGSLVHRLLQSLPDVAAEGRRDAALRYLARNTGRLDRG